MPAHARETEVVAFTSFAHILTGSSPVVVISGDTSPIKGRFSASLMPSPMVKEAAVNPSVRRVGSS